jgi:hypothetical protein
LIHIDIKCHHCGNNLMDKKLLLDNHPSVKVIIDYKGKKGTLHLSSRYGSYKNKSEIVVPVGEIVKFLCPYCKSELKSSRSCYDCNAPMVTFESTLGGYLRICSRRGCRKHGIEFENLETELRAFYEKYSTYFKGD